MSAPNASWYMRFFVSGFSCHPISPGILFPDFPVIEKPPCSGYDGLVKEGM